MTMTRKKSRTAAMLRMSAYFGVVSVVASMASAHTLKASVREATFRAAKSLATLEDLTGDAEVVSVNGAVFHRSGASTNDSPKVALDRVEEYCRERPSAIGKAFRQSDSVAKLLDGVAGHAMKDGIVRDSDENHGLVVCFERDPSQGEGPSAAESFDRLVKTGDLASVGNFRYVYAERTKDGSTHVSTIWSDGEINVKKMFPESGDAEGSDSPSVPRPLASRRVITARAEGLPHAARVYASDASPASLKTFYTAALGDRGMKALDAKNDDGLSYLAEDGRIVIVAFAPEDGKTYVSIIEASSGEIANVSARENH